jgi:hypothetical protein
MKIADSARKHGVSDHDMTHAARNAIREVDLGDDLALLIGPDRGARLLEVVIIGIDSDDPAIIHADQLRPKFFRYL